MYLLDTCVFSEFTKPRPDPKLLAWAQTVPEADQYLSVIVLGELFRGVDRLPDGLRKKELATWLDSLFMTHKDRIVTIDTEVMRVWAKLCTQAEKKGRLPSAVDSLIAASALSRGLTLVSRNVEDFKYLDVALVNPWEQ